MTRDAPPLRALLYTPANDARKLKKAQSLSADAIMLDLEDAVAEGEKDSARRALSSALAAHTWASPVGVRVNGPTTSRFIDDIRAVAMPGVRFVEVPKVETAEALDAADALLSEAEQKHRLPPCAIRVFPSVETARGLVAIDDIANAVPGRLQTLMFGQADLALDLNLEPCRRGTELLYARSRTVVAARAAGLPAPLDGPFLDLHDERGLYADTRRSRRLGFAGRAVIHPDQLQTVERAYSELNADELARLTDMVDAFEREEAAGRASIQVNGQFVDYPIYESAKRRIALHESLQG